MNIQKLVTSRSQQIFDDFLISHLLQFPFFLTGRLLVTSKKILSRYKIYKLICRIPLKSFLVCPVPDDATNIFRAYLLKFSQNFKRQQNLQTYTPTFSNTINYVELLCGYFIVLHHYWKYYKMEIQRMLRKLKTIPSQSSKVNLPSRYLY